MLNLFSQRYQYAPVAQLDRVRGYEPRGREFESLRARHKIKHLRPTIALHLSHKIAFIPQMNPNRLQIGGVVTINGPVIPLVRRTVKGSANRGTLIAPSAWVKL